MTRIQAYWASRPRPTVWPRSMRPYEWRRLMLHLDGMSIQAIAQRDGIKPGQARYSISMAHRRLAEAGPRLACPTCDGLGWVPASPGGPGAVSS